MMFANKQYPLNIKEGNTYFIGLQSDALGDRILSSMIKKQYAKDNPDEELFYIENPGELKSIFKPCKVFYRADVNFVGLDRVQNDINPAFLFQFELHNECHELWKMGVYPDLVDIGIELPAYHLNGSEYLVFHIRNVKKIPGKNTDPAFVRAIMERIIAAGWQVFLVGNDNSYGEAVEFLSCDLVHDFRKKLSLQKIAELINRCKLFIGSDSGICHLAGCCNAPMVSWGYVSELWFPKVRDLERCLFLTKEETRLEVIEREVLRRLCDGR